MLSSPMPINIATISKNNFRKLYKKFTKNEYAVIFSKPLIIESNAPPTMLNGREIARNFK